MVSFADYESVALWEPRELRHRCVAEWVSSWEDPPWSRSEEEAYGREALLLEFVYLVTHAMTGLQHPYTNITGSRSDEAVTKYYAERAKHPVHRIKVKTTGWRSWELQCHIIFRTSADTNKLAIETLRRFAERAGFYAALGRPFRKDDIKIRIFGLTS